MCVCVSPRFMNVDCSFKNKKFEGPLWRSSGQDCTLSLPRVESLVRELRSRKLCGVAKISKYIKFAGCWSGALDRARGQCSGLCCL